MDSEFYTLEVNSGLLINTNGLNYKEVNIFIVGFGSINVYIMLLIVDGITFPQTTLINQFLLPKKTKIQFDYYINDKNENAISIVSKYSLRNINIKITNQDKSDITSEKGGYVYQNGFSFLFDMSKYQTGTYSIEIENKNINSRDEIIILGYTKFNGEQTFPNSIVNRFRLYLEKLYDSLWNLKNTLSTPFYYTYQIYGKNVEFAYIDSSGSTKGTNKIQEYNSMVSISVPTNKMSFKFENIKNI